jgi:hypothetical protein
LPVQAIWSKWQIMVGVRGHFEFALGFGFTG